MTWKALTRDEALVWNIPALIERGYTDEEIVDHIEHSPVLANQRFSMRDKRTSSKRSPEFGGRDPWSSRPHRRW